MAGNPKIVSEERERPRWPVWLVAGIVFLNGLNGIFNVLFYRISERFERFEGILPLDYEYYGRFFSLFAGFALIYISGRLLARKRIAWRIAFGGSILIILIQGLLARDLAALVLPAAALVILALYSDEFVVGSDPASFWQGARLLGLSVLIALAYGTVGFARMLPHDFLPMHHISISEGAVRTVREFTLIGNGDLTTRTKHAQWFLDSLDVFGLAAIGFAFLSLFRPLGYRFATLPQERLRARELLEKYGKSSEDLFKLWPEDKSYFFLGSSFLAYRAAGGVAVVLGEPVGPAEELPGLVAAFRQYCHVRDWQVAFIYVPGIGLSLFEKAGFKTLKIGEDAVVEIPRFMDDVARNKHFRGVRNKFNRLGYEFRVSEPAHEPAVLAAAGRVSRRWLGEDDRAERGFALGYFNRAYLSNNRLYLLYKDQRLVAFANGIKSFNPRQETVDLMRYLPDSETGAMDFLFLSIIVYLHEQGVQEFSLGFVPGAGEAARPDAPAEERFIGRIKPLLLRGFSFEGLRRFKNKFEPRWEDRFISYERGPAGLARTALAMGRVMKKRPF